MVEKLANREAKLTEASLNALRELVAALPDLNLFDAPEVTTLRDRIQADLCRLDPASLSESRTDRGIALHKANSILSTMAPWLAMPDAEAEAA